MARTRRATIPPEEEAPAPKVSDKSEERAFWMQAASVSAVMVLVVAVYFLLQIHAPSLARLFVGAGGVGTGLLAALAVMDRLRGSKALSPFFDELTKRASRALGKSWLAAALAGAASILAPVTVFHWQASAHCTVLRIVPGGAFAYYLMDGEDADKPPEKTFEIRVRWKGEVRRFHPRDERSLDVGASASILRWRAGREPEGKEPPERSFLGTDRFHAGDEVTIEIFCRRPDNVNLGRITKTIADGQPSLEIVRLTVDEDEFSRKVGACEPI